MKDKFFTEDVNLSYTKLEPLAMLNLSNTKSATPLPPPGTCACENGLSGDCNEWGIFQVQGKQCQTD